MLIIKDDPNNSGAFIVYGQRTGKTFFTGTFEACRAFIDMRRAEIKKAKRKANARAINQILRDLTGTSAAAARRDMGLNSGGY